MAEFYGYFSLVDNGGINFLAILYRREDHSLAARKFIVVPSFVSNIFQIKWSNHMRRGQIMFLLKSMLIKTLLKITRLQQKLNIFLMKISNLK